jgi:hypothetical protein
VLQLLTISLLARGSPGLEATGTRGDMTGSLLEGLLEWGPADSITHLDVLTSAPAEELDHTTATFGCLNCHVRETDPCMSGLSVRASV